MRLNSERSALRVSTSCSTVCGVDEKNFLAFHRLSLLAGATSPVRTQVSSSEMSRVSCSLDFCWIASGFVGARNRFFPLRIPPERSKKSIIAITITATSVFPSAVGITTSVLPFSSAPFAASSWYGRSWMDSGFFNARPGWGFSILSAFGKCFFQVAYVEGHEMLLAVASSPANQPGFALQLFNHGLPFFGLEAGPFRFHKKYVPCYL